jgi:hypothetical protein
MIKIENVEVTGFEAAIRGMRNPMNSWEKSDSQYCDFVMLDRKCSICEWDHMAACCNTYIIGPNDHKLMMQLAKGGPVHAKYRRMINVSLDIVAPLYWWKEFDTYKVGTVADSCSTMHKIAEKEFTLDDFSHEHLPKGSDAYSDTWDFSTSKNMFHINDDDPIYISAWGVLNLTIAGLNHFRNMFLATKDKKYWWQMIQLLPTSYNQRRTVVLNYEVLNNIHHSRKNHKLDEWVEFCKWIESLPCSEVITGGDEKDGL